MTKKIKASQVQRSARSSAIVQTNPITLLSLRSMFWRPAYLEQSAWLEHIPFAFWLVEALRPRILVELGVHYGVSYFAFCQAVDRLDLDTRCFAVDTWEGDEHAGFYDEHVFEKVMAYNDAQYSGFSRLVRSSFGDALKHFEDGSIDLLHIDGMHSLEAVQHDFETWLPKLSHCAIVVMHDTNVRERGFGVFKLFASLKEQYPHFEFVHGHGLGVLGAGMEQDDILRQLFKADATEHTCQAIHEIFGRLGRACADSLAASQHQERAKILTGDVNKQKKQLGELKQSLDKSKTDLNSRSKELNETKSRLQSQIEQHAVERGHLAERVSLLQELRTELKDDVAKLHARINVTSKELFEKSHQLAIFAKQINENEQQIVSGNERIEERNRDVADLTEKLNERLAQEQALNQTLTQLGVERKQEEATHQKELNKLKNDLKSKDEALKATEQQLSVVEAKSVKVQAEQDASMDRMDAENQQLKLDQQSQAKKIEALEDKLYTNDQEVATQQKELNKQERDLKSKVEALKIAEQQLAAVRTEAGEVLVEKDAALTRLESENKKLKTDKQAQAKNIEVRFKELATLTKMLEERNSELIAKKQEIETAQQHAAHLNNSLSWKITTPLRILARPFEKVNKESISIRKQIKVIEKSGLFDKAWYLKQYPDVVKNGADPIEQYIRHGAVEGKNPSPNFETVWYIETNPDVAEAGCNPLVHYIQFGNEEGRRANKYGNEVR